MRILVATNNPAKLKRVRGLLAGASVECCGPDDLGIPAIEIEEGSDIYVNAEAKARAYFGKTDLPILGMDTALVIPGEDMDPARVRRNALDGHDERALTQEEIAEKMIAFYCSVVARRGGPVPAHWEDVFALVLPDGSVHHEQGKRPITLTGETRGTVDPYFPIRSMYLGPTGKYVADQTPEDEHLELKPYQDALRRLLGVQV